MIAHTAIIKADSGILYSAVVQHLLAKDQSYLHLWQMTVEISYLSFAISFKRNLTVIPVSVNLYFSFKFSMWKTCLLSKYFQLNRTELIFSHALRNFSSVQQCTSVSLPLSSTPRDKIDNAPSAAGVVCSIPQLLIFSI